MKDADYSFIAEFTELYEPIKQKLFNYIKLETKNYHLAQDVLQNVLILAFDNFLSLRDRSKFKAWIYKIAHREAIAQIKKYRRELFIDDVYQDNPDNLIISNIEEIEKQIIKKEAINQVVEILKTMLQKEKDFMIRYYYDDASYKELATEMNTSQGALRVMHYRILRKIADRMGEIGID